MPRASERRAARRRGWSVLLIAVVLLGGGFWLWRFFTERGETAGGTTPGTPVAADAAPHEPVTADADQENITRPTARSASSDADFIRQLGRVEAHRALADTPYEPDVLELVAGLQIPAAVQLLEGKAAAGDRDANVVLARLIWLCEGNDPSASGSPEVTSPPQELKRRIDASRAADAQRQADLARACGEAQFDAVAIDVRLQDAAAAGHEASLWEVGRRSLDPAIRHKNWLSAAMLGYVPAQVGLAENLMAESMQGDRRNRGRMNFWLEAAAKQSPHALRLRGECRLNGCNAQPPDSEAAVPLLRDAALQGEAGAFTALASISSGDPAALPDSELFALQSFLQQLNELGCFGAADYGSMAIASQRSLQEIGGRISPSAFDAARTQASTLWREHSQKARQVRGCD
jgi:hypothetical protein